MFAKIFGSKKYMLYKINKVTIFIHRHKNIEKVYKIDIGIINNKKF